MTITLGTNLVNSSDAFKETVAITFTIIDVRHYLKYYFT